MYMLLVLNDGTVISNATCGDKIIEIQIDDYSKIASIYASATNDNLNGAYYETSAGVIMGRYSNIMISSTITDPINNKVRFTLTESTTEEFNSLKMELEQVKAQHEESMNDYDDTVISLASNLASLV